MYLAAHTKYVYCQHGSNTINPPNINNDHLVEPFVTNTGNDTSTSAAPGVTKYCLMDLQNKICSNKYYNNNQQASKYIKNIKIHIKDPNSVSKGGSLGFTTVLIPRVILATGPPLTGLNALLATVTLQIRLTNVRTGKERIPYTKYRNIIKEHVKGWISKQPNAKVQEKTRSSTKNLSKAALKQKLKEALDNMEKYDEHQIMKMIEDVASTESSSEDNRDMCDPKGLAYMDPDYE
ncbi:hypothetical protein KY285_005450 [Solanum tuberosum]|nr:hypothetical protein KY285_005450 [Solanum tuberosum]